MFAYCGNDPVNQFDTMGCFPLKNSDPNAMYVNGLDGEGSGGGVGVVLGIGWFLSKVKDTILSYGAIAIAIQTYAEAINGGEYYVYVLVDSDKTVQYVGRTKNPVAREAAHKRNPFRSGLEFNIIGANLKYPQARGLEQTLMLYYHTICTDDKKNNQINGIRLNNPEIDTYLLAAKNTLGYLWNQVSNEVLVWSGK